MADEENKDVQEQTQEEGKESKKGKKGKMLPLIIILIAVMVNAGLGLGLGLMLGKTPATDEEQAQEGQAQSEDPEDLKAMEEASKNWYYDLDPVIANLDEPGVTRFARLTLTFEFPPEADQLKTTEYIESKKPQIISWVNIFLAGLSTDDIRGDSNLKQIQGQLKRALNEEFLSGTNTEISNVLFKEFAVQ